MPDSPWIRCQPGQESAWAIDMTAQSIAFYPCGVVSHHPVDIKERFCAFCSRFIPENSRVELKQGPNVIIYPRRMRKK